MPRYSSYNALILEILYFGQKPLMLHGHERSITQIKYNRDGDLLFSSAKDTKPNVWYSLNGERLGTYNGHGGAVWCIDVDCILGNYCALPQCNTDTDVTCRQFQN